MTPADLQRLRELATSRLCEHWHGTDTVMLAESVIALLDECDRLQKLVLVSPDDIVAVTNENDRLQRGFSEAIGKIKAGMIIATSNCEWCGESWPKLDGCTVAEVEAHARKHVYGCTKHPMKAERDALHDQLAAMTAARDAACDGYERFVEHWHRHDEHAEWPAVTMETIAALREVGKL
jgi:hypothetical protein